MLLQTHNSLNIQKYGCIFDITIINQSLAFRYNREFQAAWNVIFALNTIKIKIGFTINAVNTRSKIETKT